MLHHYVYKDHLGSILTTTNSTGAITGEQSFDAWGRRRNVDTWQYWNGNDPQENPLLKIPSWLFRGYTGHEHLDVVFGIELINMNARLYDPVLGRMLRWDIYAGDGSTQGFNRYSYAMNNPLKYTDPTGNWVLQAIGFVVGAGMNIYSHWGQITEGGKIHWGKLIYAGAVGGGTGLAVSLGIPVGAGVAAGIISGAVAGGAGYALQTAFNNPVFGDLLNGRDFGYAVLGGAIVGGLTGIPKVSKAIQKFDKRISDWVDGKLRLPSGRNPQITLSEGETTTGNTRSQNYEIDAEIPEGNSRRVNSGTDVFNSRGEMYPQVSVDGYGEIPLPGGPYTPNNSDILRSSFTSTYKTEFKEWWISQGRTWPTPTSGSRIDIHHIRPLGHGGTNSFNNLVPLDYNTQHKLFTRWWTAVPKR